MRVPSVLQMEAVECGAASLAMILAHFGRVVPLEELRVVCGVSRDGSRAHNILRAGRSYGLLGKAYRKEVADLRRIPTPLIAHWNFNHFLVIEGFRGKKVFLNDPATGPRTIRETELDACFTGVVLSFDRSPTFEGGGQRHSVLRALRRRLAGTSLALAFLLVVGLLWMMLVLVTPAFLTIFVDDVLIAGMRDWAVPLNLAMLLTGAGLALLTYVQQQYVLRLETKLALAQSARLLWHLLTLPIGFFLQRSAGELGTRVAVNERIAQVLSVELASGLLGVCAILLYVTFMLEYDAWLTLVILFTTALNVVAVQGAARQRVNLNRRLSQDQGKMVGTAMGGLQSIETLKAMGGESDFFARWSGYQTKVLSVQQSLKLQTDLLGLVPPLLTMVNTILILGVGGHRVMDGTLTIGMLVAFQSFVYLVAVPAQQVVALGNSLQEAAGQLGRLEDVVDTVPDPQVRLPTADEATGGTEKLAGLVELRQVTFGYSPLDPPLIENFNLTIRPGRRVALVGGSGSGKSTVARLVCGLYRPWSGAIAFDGVPRTERSHHELSHSFAVVDQDIFLFEGTVRENLTLWDTTAPEADVVRAAADACIHDEIMSRAGGYNSRVDEGGRNFSGGQAQRLEIARALCNNPTVLVLDEATSALDPATERTFDDNLRRRGCTCLIIAHRLSTIRDCDEIIVLEEGRIVQRGTHDAMKSVPGPYQRLIASEES
ncbi:MAG: NHLP family bacteriocin export ABC transporter peptidase/permease/ATPase subunit [Vicinamibacterales bacterium]